MQLLRSLLFTGFFILWSFLYACFFVLVAPLRPFNARFALARRYARSVLAVLRWTCGLDYRVEGREHLPAGNHVALIKHASTWETVAQMVLLPPQVWVLKRELTWLPAFGWGLMLLRAIAVNRDAGSSAVREVLAQGKARLAEGKWIVIFPEGTRMPPGQTRRYGVSGALLAAANDRYVVPIAHDAGYYWPRRGLLKRPGVIRVVIGPPISTAGRDPREINAQAQEWIERHSRQQRD
ncbi:MAG: 1-acyl-sn-glycerol-3-phosphate acyltransferase [Gammaproteobacteria bacterium]|nr:1-acyl-sn-glycerol-3-phosphate acyltransferase [Gammaproteobacteria bacterium]